MSVTRAILADLVAVLRDDPAAAGELRAALGVTVAAPATELVGHREMGITATEWRRAIRSGALRGARVGRRYVARRDDVEAWLASRRVTPRPPESGERVVEQDDTDLHPALRDRLARSRR